MSADNGESKFGFKNKEKAEETLVLLESHDMQYRRQTVRGLLGRAKHVLSTTKADDKVKNINDAIEVFEKWIKDNTSDAANKNTKSNSEDKVDTVPGLGFKDKEAALKTLKILEDRDPEYQKLAIKGLIGNSKRVLSGTKNEEKIEAIKEGVQILEDFLEKFETNSMIAHNCAYLAYNIIEKFPLPEDKMQLEFLAAYGGPKAKGNYKHLRTMHPENGDSPSWDIVRNRHIRKVLAKIKEEDTKLFDGEGKPTENHMQLIYWAYSPNADRLKSYANNLSVEDRRGEKRKSSDAEYSSESCCDDECVPMDADAEDDGNATKQKENKHVEGEEGNGKDGGGVGDMDEEDGETPAKKAKIA